jgi:hypothetical protein
LGITELNYKLSSLRNQILERTGRVATAEKTEVKVLEDTTMGI